MDTYLWKLNSFLFLFFLWYNLDKPKSPIFTFPLERKRFPGLMSQWMMFLECK